MIARAGSTRNSSPSVSGLQQSPLSGSLRGDEVVSTASGGHGLSGLNPGIVKTEPGVNEDTNEPISEEEKARHEQSCRAFGNKGDLLHVFGSTRIDESEIPLHTQMLFTGYFLAAVHKTYGLLSGRAQRTTQGVGTLVPAGYTVIVVPMLAALFIKVRVNAMVKQFAEYQQTVAYTPLKMQTINPL